MSGIMMMVIAIVVLGGAYIFYGRYLEKKWGIDPNAKTPAYEMEDGVDYVPADTISYLVISSLHRRCGSDQRTDPGCNLRMAAGTVMDPASVVYSSEQYRISLQCMLL